MKAKTGSVANTNKKGEFDPICQWQHEQECDILMVHVPEFKKEHLKVLVNGCGILKISGDRPPAGNSFYKEVLVPPNCNTDGIQAKYLNGVLHIVMPKKIIAPLQENHPKPESYPGQAQERLAQETSNGNATKIALNVAISVAMISVICAFSYYMYTSVMDD